MPKMAGNKLTCALEFPILGNYYDFGEEEDEVKAFSGMRR
jgi:hypothetical protein